MRPSKTPRLQPYYTITELARLVGVSRPTIYRWIAESKIETVKIGARKQLVLLGELRVKLGWFKDNEDLFETISDDQAWDLRRSDE